MEASPRDRIIRAAAELLARGGREAVSTRAVSARAGVQAPTIYRQFGDMRGLLDAVASYGFSAYLRTKVSRERVRDPVDDLRRGWDIHVEFGLANPALYTLMYADPRPGHASPAAAEADGILRELVGRVAEAGRLRVGVERASRMIHAAGCGITLTLLGTDPDERDLMLSVATREAILAAVVTEVAVDAGPERAGRNRAAARAVALRAVLPEVAHELTPGERTLLSEWLDRLIGMSGHLGVTQHE